MTVWELLSIVGRRWYIVLLGIAVAIGSFMMLRTDGAYASQARVSFVSPGVSAAGQTDDAQLETLTAFAAAVEREYHAGQISDRLSENATLYGAGLTRSVQVLLSNTGGQWALSFAAPAIDISVVGPSPQWVDDHQKAAIARIQQIAMEQQAKSRVTRTNQITTLVIPVAQVAHVGASKGTEVRAAGMLALIGVSLATAAATVVDHAVLRRRHRWSPSAIPPFRAARTAGGTR